MTIKTHYLVAASDGKSFSQLTNVYAETDEQALQEAREWHKGYAHLPILTVRAQPQGFQAGFRRLPGRVEEKMVMRWCIKERLEERGMSMKQLARLSGVSYKTIRRLCNESFYAGKPATIALVAQAFALPPSEMSELVCVATELPPQHKQTKAGE